MPPPPPENQNSSLLSTDENLQVFNLLGNKCVTLATTVVQLYTTIPPVHSQWSKKGTGVLCFVRDVNRKNYFFRLYNLKRDSMIWEHEMYNNMEYIESRPFFHMFEGEENIVAFNFANYDEARNFKNVVVKKISIRKHKEDKRARRISQSQSVRLPLQQNLDFESKQELRKEKRRRNITKADIGRPMDFIHISHVGWDPASGFDVKGDDDNLRDIFTKAGVSEKQLQNKKTRAFIYNFIQDHEGSDKGLERNPPAVPPRGPSRPPSARPAPPPPPHQRLPSNSENIPKKARPPSPPRNAGPVPPPPPPPMNIPAPPPMMDIDNAVPPPPPPALVGESELFQDIRNGTTLKPVEERIITPVEDARGDLLSEIRKGIQLKRVEDREIRPQMNSSPQNSGNDLASALAKALAERSKLIHSDDEDDETSSSSNDDEWD